MDLLYSNLKKGIDGGFFYNVKGSTLSIVGAGLFPDIYAEPFHSLNFSLNKKFGDRQNTVVFFKVTNILDDRVESFYTSYEAADEIFSSLNPGRSYGIGLRFSL
ncbi:MAG: hypothetical protein U5K79_14835 [Cyclobacteriaceae bacterium]|nr:hypothetical protein [Cyclobacteriaceae bacterium]